MIRFMEFVGALLWIVLPVNNFMPFDQQKQEQETFSMF